MGLAPCCSVCNTEFELIKEKASLCKNPFVRFPMSYFLGEPRCVWHGTSSQIPLFLALPHFLQDWVALRNVWLQQGRENILKVALKCRNDECCLPRILSLGVPNSSACSGRGRDVLQGLNSSPPHLMAEEEQNPCGIQNRNVCSYGKEQ